jgi:hypothetical protein
MRALTRAFPEYRSRYLIAVEDSRLAGVLPFVRLRRLAFDQFLSMPFGAHGGPVLAPDADPRVIEELASAFARTVMKPRTLRFEMSLFNPSPVLKEALAPALGTHFQEFRTHVVDLTPAAEALCSDRYRRGARRSVRAAERAGVTVEVDPTAEAVEALHRLHVQQGRSWAGIPPYPRSVIDAVREEFGRHARLYVARHEGAPVAACLCLDHAGREVHPWVSGATPESRSLRAFHLLIHTAIMDACRRGLAAWHFGGSGGIRAIEFFKESFGAAPVPVLRCAHLARWARRLRRRPEWDR